MARLSDFNTENQFQAVVKETKRLTPAETEEIRELLLEVPGFECQVDQSFGVLVETSGGIWQPVPPSVV